MTSNRSNKLKATASDDIHCSYCGNVVMKSAYQFSCEHIICVFCISRGIMLSSFSPFIPSESSSQADLSVIKLSCNKCLKGFVEIKIGELVNLTFLPTECLQHDPRKSCSKCAIWESQIESNSKCAFHRNLYSIAYCKTCKASICSECIHSNLHSKHKVKEFIHYQRAIDDFSSKMSLATYSDFSSWLYDKHKKFNSDYQSEFKATINKIDSLIELLKEVKQEYQRQMEKDMKNANDLFDIIYFLYYLYYKQMQSRSNDFSRLLFLKQMKQQIDSICLISTKSSKDIDQAQCYIKKFSQRKPNTFDIKISFFTAVRQSSYTFYGHQGYVFDVIPLSKEEIASCSEDKDIRIWNMKSKDCIKIISKAHSSSIYSLCKLRQKLFASGSFAEIKLWNRKTYSEEGVLTGHTDYVVKLKHLKKKGLLISSSNDKTIRTWDATSKRCLQVFTGHGGYINSFTILKDINLGKLASVSFDKTMKVWSLKESECLYEIEAHDGPIYSIVQLKDKTVLTGSYSEMKLWNLEKRECLRCIIERNTGVYDLLQLKNGRVVSCSFQAINIWDLSNEKDPWVTSLNEHSHFVTSLMLFKKKVLVSASDDKTIKIWD